MSALLYTDHAMRRRFGRSISDDAINATLDFGRRYWNHGSLVYRLDRRSIAKAKEQGFNIRQHEGIHVVLSQDGIILTAYRNRSCKRMPR